MERRGGASVVVTQLGGVLPTGREHFGYADGFSQPAIEGSRFDDHPGAGAPAKNGDWRPIAAGEFILGYPDEQGSLPAAPRARRAQPQRLLRRLPQAAPGRRRLPPPARSEAAALYPGGEELLAAKLVGRWRDGTPLDSSPHAEDPGLVADKSRNNAFDYGRDPEGLRCPVGSHIRRMNPRLSMPFEGKLVNRHRLIRRGITYGEMLPEGAEDDGADRGVIFMTVQASLARQFEFVQAQWANTGNPFRLGDDQDPIIGPMDNDGVNKMTVPGRPPFFCGPLSRVVTMRGGEYYFAPGINGLRHLALSVLRRGELLAGDQLDPVAVRIGDEADRAELVAAARVVRRLLGLDPLLGEPRRRPRGCRRPSSPCGCSPRRCRTAPRGRWLTVSSSVSPSPGRPM